MEPRTTRALAQFASQSSLDAIPQVVIEKQKDLVLDLLGCALGAVGTPEGTSALAALTQLEPGEGPSTVLGTGKTASAGGAALVNGILAHTLELDDTHAEACFHPGAPIIPAALAVAEQVGASGKDFLTGVLVGYEVGVRLAIGINPVSHRMCGWHATGTCGVLGAAAAAGRVLGLSPERMAWALGLAGVQHTGTWVFTDDGSMCKRFHSGHAAQGGVTAAFLAQAGFTGPARVVEAPDGGVFATTSDAFDLARVTRDLGEVYEGFATSPKPFSCCRHEHAALDGVLQLVADHGLKPEDVSRVLVKTNSSAFKSVAKIVEPTTITESQFSLPYSIGLAVVDRRLTPDQYSTGRIRDPHVLAVARKVEISVDPDIDRAYPKHWSADVEIRTTQGAPLRRFVKDPPGELGNPLPRSLVQEKFRALASAALPSGRVAEVESHILNIEAARSIRDVAALLKRNG